MNSYESIFKEMGESARAASIVLQQLPEKRINEVLCAIADALVQYSEQILTANHMDMDSARGVVPDTVLDRLLLSKERINQMAEGVRQVSLLPSPVGTILETINRPNGLHIEKRAVPFGVIGIIFEARPNVTAIIIGLGLVQMTVLARIIDNHQFGLLTVSLVIIALADTLSDFGIRCV